jgi:hypothetical protein
MTPTPSHLDEHSRIRTQVALAQSEGTDDPSAGGVTMIFEFVAGGRW